MCFGDGYGKRAVVLVRFRQSLESFSELSFFLMPSESIVEMAFFDKALFDRTRILVLPQEERAFCFLLEVCLLYTSRCV